MRTKIVMLLALLATATRAPAQISPGPLAKVHADLEGPLNCASCHGLRREPMAQLCLQCHREVAWLIERGRGLHAREVKQNRRECASCHPDHAGRDFALISWSDAAGGGDRTTPPPRFDHRQAGWNLEGKHATARCEGCHTARFRTSTAAALSKRRGSPGWMGLETTCVSCHRADDPHRASLGSTCESCHEAQAWSPAPNFDHARSSYPLTGKHADVPCERCHASPRLNPRRGASGGLIPVFKPVPASECSSCHDDPHAGRLSSRCSECHVTRGFDSAADRAFDHTLTRFPLRGRHATVACAGCHGTRLTQRTPPYATCAGCHADPHQGEATLAGKATDCSGCHRVDGFRAVTFSVAQHARTRFALEGKHAQVACINCHTSAAGTRGTARVVRIRMPFDRCAACHANPHGAQLAARGTGATCESCHRVAGWAPSTFSTTAHATLRVTLSGRHATAGCPACHAISRPGLPSLPASLQEALGSARVLLRVRETECAGCHVDPHAGRYRAGGARPMPGGCAACHGTETFSPSTIDVAAHAAFSFTLEGAHRAVPCAGCHEELKPHQHPTSTLLLAARNAPRLPFTPWRDGTCAGCHGSPHGAQFADRPGGGACQSCHDLERFAPASRFDHDRDAAFSLRGAHARVLCASCHKPTTTPGAVTGVIAYRPLSARCESCHAGKRQEGAS
jgi:hypothetical protein